MLYWELSKLLIYSSDADTCDETHPVHKVVSTSIFFVLPLATIDSIVGHHVTCVLIGTSCKQAAYWQPWANYKHKLVDAIRHVSMR